MRPVGLYSSVLFSISLHALLIASTLFLARRMSLERPVAPYVVSLVQEEAMPAAAPVDTALPMPETGQKSETKIVEPEPPEKSSKQPVGKKTIKKDVVKEQIAALKARKHIEDIVRLRKMINVGSVRNKQKGAEQTKIVGGGPSTGKPVSRDDYYSLMEGLIRGEWIYPESLDRDLETIITINLAPDGTFRISGVQKSSSNPLFDRSVLSAIRKITRFPQPPKGTEGEIGVRFRP
jgi:TonB family protein